MDNIITPDFGHVPKRVAPSQPAKAMLSVESDGNQTLVRINSSSLSIIQTCPRKAKYLLHDKWRSKTGAPALVFGTAIHKALEIFYSHSKTERDLPENFDEIAPLLAHGNEPPSQHFIWDALKAFVTAMEPLAMLPDNDKRSKASGVWTLMHYFKTYLNDAYVIHRDEHGPFVERTFSVPFWEDGDLRIELFGTIDFALKNEATGEILCGDHKTASQLGNDFLSRIKPNHQYTAYVYGAMRAFGIASENFLINGIQVKPKPLTARGGPPILTRQITRRTPQDFEEFQEALLWAVWSYLGWTKSNIWPLGNVDACSTWGGCQFLDVCSAPNQLRQNILESKYIKE